MRSCFFFHNPKAGGTALREALSRYFAPREIAPCVDLTPEVYGPPEESVLTPGHRLYMGHYGYDLYRTVAEDHMLVTNFRHPAGRVLSLYNYFRQSVPDGPAMQSRPEYFAVRLARVASFDDFVASEDPRVITYTSNHHFRQLASSGWSLSVNRTFDDVCQLIDDMAWYYVCEYPVLSMRWARAALKAPDFAIGSANVTPAAPEVTADLLGISQETFSRILQINDLDLGIYAHGLARFFQEIRELARPRPSLGQSLQLPAGVSLGR